MRRHAAGVALTAVLAAYLASPYIALYRLDRAMRAGDASYINAHVDWDALRQGVVAQIDLAMTGQVAQKEDVAALPSFGSGFVHHMATHIVDKATQREAVMARLRQFVLETANAATPAADTPAAAPPVEHALHALHWACFDSPTSFQVELGDGAGQDVTIEMRLVGGVWQVTRADMPSGMLLQTASRT